MDIEVQNALGLCGSLIIRVTRGSPFPTMYKYGLGMPYLKTRCGMGLKVEGTTKSRDRAQSARS
jgi:hypothetical protein